MADVLKITAGATAIEAVSVAAGAGGSDVSLGEHNRRRVTLLNTTATAVVYLGKNTSQASAADGFPWDSAAHGALTLDVEPGEAWFVKSAGADQALRILVEGR